MADYIEFIGTPASGRATIYWRLSHYFSRSINLTRDIDLLKKISWQNKEKVDIINLNNYLIGISPPYMPASAYDKIVLKYPEFLNLCCNLLTENCPQITKTLRQGFRLHNDCN